MAKQGDSCLKQANLSGLSALGSGRNDARYSV